MVPPIGRRASDVALRFASPRKGALGCEVSDELTVPLCSVHPARSPLRRRSCVVAAVGIRRRWQVLAQTALERTDDMIDAQKI
jgi:hypothetical protein